MARREEDEENPRKQAASFTNDFVAMTNEVAYLRDSSHLKPELHHFHAWHERLTQLHHEMQAIQDTTRNSGSPHHMANIYARKMIQWRQKLCKVEDALKHEGVDEGHPFRDSIEKALHTWMQIHRDMRAEQVEPLAHPDAEWNRRNMREARKVFREQADKLYHSLGRIEDDAPELITWLRSECDHNIDDELARKLRRCSSEIKAMNIDTDFASHNPENTTLPGEETLKRYAAAVVAADQLIALGDAAMYGMGVRKNEEYRQQRSSLSAETRTAAKILSQLDVQQQDTDLYMIAHREEGRRQG